MRQQALSQCRPRSLSLYVVTGSQWVKPCHIELCCTWVLDHPVQQGYIYLEAVHVVVHLSKAPPWSLLEVHRTWYIDCSRHSVYASVHTQRKWYGDSLWWCHDMEMFFLYYWSFVGGIHSRMDSHTKNHFVWESMGDDGYLPHVGW